MYDLLSAYFKTSDPKSSAEGQVRSVVKQFQDKINSKVKAGNYGPQDFMNGTYEHV